MPRKQFLESGAKNSPPSKLVARHEFVPFPRPLSPASFFLLVPFAGNTGSLLCPVRRTSIGRRGGWIKRRGSEVKVATRYGLIRKCTWPIKASRLTELQSRSAVGKVPEVPWTPSALEPRCNPFRAFTLSTQIYETLSPFSSCLILLSSFFRVFPARETRPCTHFAY